LEINSKTVASPSDKNYMTISDSAVGGIHRAEANLDSIAQKVARPTTPSAAAADQVDLSDVMVGLIQSRNEVAVDVKVLQTADQMGKTVLNILA
jgi:hypothetical protein